MFEMGVFSNVVFLTRGFADNYLHRMNWVTGDVQEMLSEFTAHINIPRSLMQNNRKNSLKQNKFDTRHSILLNHEHFFHCNRS